MSQAVEFYIGRLKLEVIDDAYLVEVSFTDSPPRQDQLKDLPSWTISSKNAIWFVQEEQPILNRACHGEEIKEDFLTSHKNRSSTGVSAHVFSERFVAGTEPSPG